MKKSADRPTLKIVVPVFKQTKHSGVELSAYLDGGPLTFFYWSKFCLKMLDAMSEGKNISIAFVDNVPLGDPTQKRLLLSSTYGKTVTKAAKGGKR